MRRKIKVLKMERKQALKIYFYFFFYEKLATDFSTGARTKSKGQVCLHLISK